MIIVLESEDIFDGKMGQFAVLEKQQFTRREKRMPQWLHRKLAKQARKKKLKGDRAKAYVYSVLQRYKKAHGG